MLRDMRDHAKSTYRLAASLAFRGLGGFLGRFRVGIAIGGRFDGAGSGIAVGIEGFAGRSSGGHNLVVARVEAEGGVVVRARSCCCSSSTTTGDHTIGVCRYPRAGRHLQFCR